MCNPYVRQECNASRDVICQECQTCGPGFYVHTTCGASYGNDRLDTQCAVCPAVDTRAGHVILGRTLLSCACSVFFAAMLACDANSLK